MYIKIICNECEKQFVVDFRDKELNIERCPFCNSLITHADHGYMNGLTELFYNHSKRLKGVRLASIHTGDRISAESIEYTDMVFNDDIERLKNIYENSSEEVQKIMTGVVDQLYLLINSDSTKGDLENLNKTYEKLHTIFIEKVDEQNKQFEL